MQQVQDLSKLSLKQLLQLDLQLEQLLVVKDVHTKIKINMKIFVDYLRKHPIAAHKFIAFGIKFPMHQSNNLPMKTRTHIAADILTSDHQTLADFFIQPIPKDYLDQIEEEIETQDEPTCNTVPPEEQYIYLISILDYILEPEPDENCLNYLTKALQTLIRKKISAFLQFFLQQPKYFQRLQQLSHFPSVSHLLAKMLTDDDDDLTPKALQFKHRIVPAFLQKVHQEINRQSTLQVMQGIQDILNSSRYADIEERTQLQKDSDMLVGAEEVQFMVKTLQQNMSCQCKTVDNLNAVLNVSTYLGLIVNRMSMDEQQELLFGSTGPQEFKPNLKYSLQLLFLHYCRIVSSINRLWEFRPVSERRFAILPIRVLEPLTLMSKHSVFGVVYPKIPLEERSLALQAILKLTCSTDISGIMLQGCTSLLEKMLNQEERLAEVATDIVPPSQLYLAVQNYAGAISASISLILEETRKQRNMNQKGIYFRKNLLLLDNYFKHPNVVAKFPHTPKLEALFPSFNYRNCRLYAEKAIVLDHPGGNKAPQVEEFKFIARNLHLIRSNIPQEHPQISIEKEFFPREVREVKEDKDEKPKEILSKLDSKFKARKERVKQQTTDKGSANLSKEMPIQQSPKKQRQLGSQEQVSPSRGKEQQGLSFFVRHLLIF